MITRGHFIGDIVDSLATVAERIEMRASLGLTDINRYTEDFAKEALNRTLGLQLINANDERINAPGIDLIDAGNGIAYQVTSERSSKKVNTTLERVAALDQRPETLRILVLGKKQNRYALDERLTAHLNFTEESIWDLTDLASRIVGLPLDVLQDLHSYISRELARVRIELELPTPEGEYPTTIARYIEALPSPRWGNFGLVRQHLIDQSAEEAGTWEQTRQDLEAFVRRLMVLPRITRDFFAFLIERADGGAADGNGQYAFDYSRLKRICSYPDMVGEIEILEDARFTRFYRAEAEDERSRVLIRRVGHDGFALVSLVDSAKECGLSLTRLFVTLDFSGLDTEDAGVQAQPAEEGG